MPLIMLYSYFGMPVFMITLVQLGVMWLALRLKLRTVSTSVAGPIRSTVTIILLAEGILSVSWEIYLVGLSIADELVPNEVDRYFNLGYYEGFSCLAALALVCQMLLTIYMVVFVVWRVNSLRSGNQTRWLFWWLGIITNFAIAIANLQIVAVTLPAAVRYIKVHQAYNMIMLIYIVAVIVSLAAGYVFVSWLVRGNVFASRSNQLLRRDIRRIWWGSPN